MEQSVIELQKAIHIRQAMSEYRDMAYLNMVQQINTKAAAVLKDDMGSQFVQSCGRDLAGEIVRNYFDTSSYNITVDQLAMRILKFSYEGEYDPLGENGGVGEVHKSVYNYNELRSADLDKIAGTMDSSQQKLFEIDRESDKLDDKGRKAYRQQQRDEHGDLYDELTGIKETKKSVYKNGKEELRSDLQADHVQARESAKYSSRYVTETGAEALRQFWNSSDNMQMMHASANTSKGDIRVCSVDGEIRYVNARSKEYDPKTDITHKATPEVLADAVCKQWESIDGSRLNESAKKIATLKEKGFLNDEGKVPKSVRKELERNIRHSQNVESKVVLKNAKIDVVAEDANAQIKASIGKIIAGQVIYYAAPPLVYELRLMMKNRNLTLDDALENLKHAAGRIAHYVVSKLKDIFSNVLFNSLKKFVKSFMDILVNLVKATVKKLLKVAKNLALSTVDAVRIIADKNSSPAEKADSVFNLFGITITSCVLEILFELAADTLHIPEPFDEIVFGPLQILATVVCTNLTMLILQKADLFNARFGFKVNAMRSLFEEERAAYEADMSLAEGYTTTAIEEIIMKAKKESKEIFKALGELDPKTTVVRPELDKINRMFTMNINFDAEWLRFLGIQDVEAIMA